MVNQLAISPPHSNQISSTVLSQSLKVLFGQPTTKCCQTANGIEVHLKIPVLGGTNQEQIFSGLGKTSQKLGFQTIESDRFLVGALTRKVDFPLKETAYEVYQNLLQLTQDWHLYRIWHYVPYINQETFSLENYRSFCQGRSLAFESFYGGNFTFKLPAASAVGINDNYLVVYFIAGKTKGEYLENPEQVSAYRYPQKYGKRPPSFARGTILINKNRQIGYLSGTASIKSHQSVTLSRIVEQLYTTVDNMSLVFEAMGLVAERQSYGNFMPDPDRYSRAFKVYLRSADDLPLVRSLFPRVIMSVADDRLVYLQSDICRAELDLEIEAVIKER